MKLPNACKINYINCQEKSFLSSATGTPREIYVYGRGLADKHPTGNDVGRIIDYMAWRMENRHK